MGIHDFRKGYQRGTNIAKDERVIDSQTPTVFFLGEDAISLSYLMYIGLMMLVRQKYIQQSH
jgi:hypothetical protein